ncbi:MAG: GNAT family N-acetyltransferase [Hyphomonadaceae bacterium]
MRRKSNERASPAEEEAIRAAVRCADVRSLGERCELPPAAHVPGLVELLSDPLVSGPIYDLPNPINAGTIAAWLLEAEQKRAAGEAILTVTLDEQDRIYTYSRFTIWPERASAEIAGAYRSDMQNVGAGKAGAARSFGWMFNALGVQLICVTAALDNVRSARVIEAAGFQPMGEREATRADGTIRRSRYWEMTREAWAALHPETKSP